MNNALQRTIGYALIASLALMPTAGFAKSDNGNKHDDTEKVEVEAHASFGGCIKAFGHLIAPGWIKHNGAVSVDERCSLPFGIAKKLDRESPPPTPTPPPPPPPATTTPDTTAPTIFFVGAKTGTSTAAVSWFTNERSDSQIAYGTTTAYGSTTTVDGTLRFAHHVSITGLAPGTTYHFRVMSKDASGNLATSSDREFTTKALPDTTAPTISATGTSGVSSTTATVSWTTNEPSNSKVFYGTSSPFDLTSTTTSSVNDGALVTSHALTLTGLTASTTYSFVVQSDDGSGNRATSSVQSLVTTP